MGSLGEVFERFVPADGLPAAMCRSTSARLSSGTSGRSGSCQPEDRPPPVTSAYPYVRIAARYSYATVFDTPRARPASAADVRPEARSGYRAAMTFLGTPGTVGRGPFPAGGGAVWGAVWVAVSVILASLPRKPVICCAVSSVAHAGAASAGRRPGPAAASPGYPNPANHAGPRRAVSYTRARRGACRAGTPGPAQR